MDENNSGAVRRGRLTLAPTLESLEGRRLMSAGVPQVSVKEVTIKGTVELLVTGTNRADIINITDNGTGTAGNVTVSVGDGQTYVSTSPIGAIYVLGKGGNDQVTYNLTGTLVAPQSVVVNLGAGNDQFTANLTGDIDNPTGLDLEAYGDAGNDTLTINQTGKTLEGSVFPFLDGGAGNDTLTYNGTGNIASGASLMPGLAGDAGNDTITSHYTGQIDGNYVYNLTADGGSGNDTIVDTIDATAGSTGSIGSGASSPAAVLGDGGNDQILYTIDAPATMSGVNAVAVGGAGKDVVERTSNVTGDKSNETDTIVS